MENCKEYSELLSAFVDGELSNEECELVEKHLASCPECKAHLAMLEKIHAEAAALVQEVPEGFSSRVMQAVAASQKSEKKFFLARFKFTAIAAAILLLVFAAGRLDSFAPRLAENSSDAAAGEDAADTQPQTSNELIPAAFSPVYDASESKTAAEAVPAKQHSQAVVEKGRASNTSSNELKKPVQRQEATESAPPTVESDPAPVEESVSAPETAEPETDAGIELEAKAEDDSSATADRSDQLIENIPAAGGGGGSSSGSSAMPGDGSSAISGGMTADTTADAGSADSAPSETVEESSADESVNENSTTAAAPPMPKVPQADAHAFYIVVEAEAALSLFSDYPSNLFEGNYLISFEKGQKSDIVSRLKGAELTYYEYEGDAEAANALIIIVP